MSKILYAKKFVLTYSISGVVYDADGTTPVSGATVTIGSSSTISAVNGTYVIAGLVPGTSGSLTCTKTNYVWTARTVTPLSGNLTSQNFVNAWWAVGGLGANAVGAYSAMGRSTVAEALVNLVTPGTHDLTNVNGHKAIDEHGCYSPGSISAYSSYFGTDIIGDYGWSLFLRFYHVDWVYTHLMGCRVVDYFALYIDYAAPSKWTFYRGPAPTDVNSTHNASQDNGTVAICNRKLYADGALEATNANTATGALPAAYRLGAVDESSMVAHTWQYFAIYNTELSLANNQALHAATLP
jgi:hypothetical protein